MAGPEEPVPLYVRLPKREARWLHRTAFERGISKRELVTMLVKRQAAVPETFNIPVPPPGTDVLYGRHEFLADPAPEVLTSEQAAAFLQVPVETVVELANDGKLPGRRLGGEWRFARAALVDWLGAGESG
jgi:excisionase family DNA binding protein